MRCLLTTLNAKYIHLNLAIRQLYALNKDTGLVDLKEFTIRQLTNEIAQQCYTYDVVAFSCYIWNIKPTLAVARAIKQLNPMVKILLGGPEVSYEYEDVISRDEVDFIIIGEGEIPFSNFIQSYPEISSVHNLVFKKDNRVIVNYLTQNFELKNYTGINPYQYDAPEDLWNKVCYIETSRGCPYHCEFCLASLDNKVRYLPETQIKENLLYLMKHGRVIKFLDRTFNVKKDFAISIFKFILEHAKPHHQFQFEITADIVHPDIVKFIDEEVPKGLFRFEIGIQTVNQEANLQVKRKQDFDKTAAVIKKLEHKIEMHLDLIVGLPQDYLGDIKYSLESVMALSPPELQLGFLKFLKGTPMRINTEVHGYKYDPEPPYQLIESKYLNQDELRSILHLEEALELYWNKRRGKRTLQYVMTAYSIWDFLFGLGAYFNEKSDFHKHTLEEAYSILNQYASVFTPEDKILKELIAVDYYLHQKVKPKPEYILEIPLEQKKSLENKLGLNRKLFQYRMIPVSFNVMNFESSGKIEKGNYVLIFVYDGVNKAEILDCV